MKDGHLGKCFECWELFTSDKERVLAVAESKQKEEPKIEPVEVIVPTEVEKPKVERKPRRKRKYQTEEERIAGRRAYQREYYHRRRGDAKVAKELIESKREYARQYYATHKAEASERNCRYQRTEKGKAAQKRARDRWYEKLKADPVRWKAYIEKQMAYKRNITPEQVERRKATARDYYHRNREYYLHRLREWRAEQKKLANFACTLN